MHRNSTVLTISLMVSMILVACNTPLSPEDKSSAREATYETALTRQASGSWSCAGSNCSQNESIEFQNGLKTFQISRIESTNTGADCPITQSFTVTSKHLEKHPRRLVLEAVPGLTTLAANPRPKVTPTPIPTPTVHPSVAPSPSEAPQTDGDPSGDLSGDIEEASAPVTPSPSPSVSEASPNPLLEDCEAAVSTANADQGPNPATETFTLTMHRNDGTLSIESESSGSNPSVLKQYSRQ